MCKCVKEYIFNRTKTFNGVTFIVGETYQVDLGTTDGSDLVAVIQPNPYAYVGMSKSRFAEHFIFLERRDQMINLKTNCNTCIHSEVCKNKDIPDCVREKIDNMVSKRIVLDEFDAVNIDISCPNFKRETFQK